MLDVRLPGLSGLALQRELAAADFAIPIIFITGHGDIPMSVQAMKAGAVEFLTKPFRDQELLDAIHQAIQRDSVNRKQRAEDRRTACTVRLIDAARTRSAGARCEWSTEQANCR